MADIGFKVAAVGGVFFLLSFWHFVTDWIFQNHREATQKASNAKVRARHCTIYTIGMLSLLCLAMPRWDSLLASGIVLWVSHFLIDTYIPVYLWAKYVRRDPTFYYCANTINFFTKRPCEEDSDLDRFKAMAKTPIGLILLIAVDQALHMSFLIPISVVVTYPTADVWCLAISLIYLAALALVVRRGFRAIRATVEPSFSHPWVKSSNFK